MLEFKAVVKCWPNDHSSQTWKNGSSSPGRVFAQIYVISCFVLKHDVTKPEEQPLFAQLFLRDFITRIIRKTLQVTVKPLHHTSLKCTLVLYSSKV